MMAFAGQIVAVKFALSKNSRVSNVTVKIPTGSNTCPAGERSGNGAAAASELAAPVSGMRSGSGPAGGRPCTAAAIMLENPVLSGIYRSAAAVALASAQNNQ